MRNERKHPAMRTRTAAISHRNDLEQKAGSPIEWVLATEAPVKIWDWDRGEMVDEVLLASGMIVPAAGQVPLLDTHNRYSIARLHGHVKEFATGEQDGLAINTGKVFFASDAESQTAEQKVRGGHLTDGSVGYTPIKKLYVPEGERAVFSGREFEGPTLVVYQWQLKEFSLCAIGADEYAKQKSGV